MRKQRVGAYLWGGPGTVRLLHTKYHSPTVDVKSFEAAYDHSYLAQAKSLLGITDAWVTYSWGFSQKTEKEDYAFLRKRLPNFQKLGIRTHAYVQGLNVVTKEFENETFFCQDLSGNRLPYSKGRSFICPNNPSAQSFVQERVKQACKEDVDGVFVDNILFGSPPFFIRSDYLPFFGCSCKFCQIKFENTYGYALPLSSKQDSVITDYLRFRANSIDDFIQTLSQIARQAKKEFGINLYDPILRNDVLFYGYSLPSLQKSLDYFLIENHSLPSQPSEDNTHLKNLVHSTKKPTFVVSYKEGIGYEPSFTQEDLEAIFTEVDQIGYSPCIKLTEFTTRGIWHVLDLTTYRKVTRHFPLHLSSYSQKVSPGKSNLLERTVISLTLPSFMNMIAYAYESPFLSHYIDKSNIYKNVVRKHRNYSDYEIEI